MPTSLPFIGAPLSLESAVLIAPATLRVRFTNDPLTASPVGANDALNPSNYSLSGGAYSLATIITVSGDPQGVDLLFVAPLPAGSWIVTVSNIKTAATDPLVSPTSLHFSVGTLSNQEPVSHGAVNVDPEEIIHKHANPALKTRKNKGWKALVAALATGDKTNWLNAQLAFDQLFKSSASGLYLDRRCADDGVVRPGGIGMPDDLYRKLAIRESNNRLTQEAMLEILEVFYGIDSVRAYAETGLTEPYVLNDQDGLSIFVDERTLIPVTFLQASFAQIGQAKAIEVAAAITAAFRAAKNNGYALAVLDPSVNKYRVRIYSPSLGLGSAIRITAGKAQNGLQFADILPIYTGVGALPTWAITFDAPTNTMRFTSTTATGIDLSLLRVGDYVNIYGAEFLTANQGSYSVTNVSVSYPSGTLTQYFEVINPACVPQVLGGAQTLQGDVLYFRPSKQTTQKAPTRAVVVSQGVGAARVLLPATTAAVGRSVASGAYGQANSSFAISSISRAPSGLVTVTAPTHGLPMPTAALPTVQVFVDGTIASSTPPSITAGNPAGAPATTDYALRSIASDLKTTTQSSCYRHTAIPLSTGDVLVYAGYNIAGGVTTIRIVSELFSPLGTVAHGDATQYQYNWLASAGPGGGTGWAFGISLNDGNGKALIGGGLGGGGTAGAGCGLYTPAVGGPGAFGAAGNLNHARACCPVVSTGSGAGNAVLVFGGALDDITSLSSIEIYSPSLNTWSNAPSNLTATRTNATATVLGNGSSILIAGGRQMGAGKLLNYTGPGDMATTVLQTCEIYAGGAVSATGSMAYARFGHGAVLLPDGRVLVAGGWGYIPSQSSTPALITTTEIWDPNTGLWAPAGEVLAREFPSVEYVASLNRVYVVGGGETAVEYLDLSTMRWHRSLASLALAHKNAIGVQIAYGSKPLILLTGGVKANGDTIDTNALIVPTNERVMTGRLNGLVTATVVDANTFTFVSSQTDFTTCTGGTGTWASASHSSIPGPYTFDPVSGTSITSKESTITQVLNKGHQYNSITVADATQFPDSPGWLCFGFGTANATYPVPYLGRLSPTALFLDFTYVFPRNVPSGAKVTLLYQKGAWVPSNPQSVGSFYLTASASGRIAAQKALDDVSASGIQLTKVVEYPGDRGLGNAGYPDSGYYKLSDRVAVWGGDDLDAELATARSS